MFIRFLALIAALTIPAAALAQVGASKTATVEIVATGAIDVPATSFTVDLSYSVQGDDEAAAEEAKAKRLADIRAAIQKLGLSAEALVITPGSATTTSSIDLDGPMAEDAAAEDAEADAVQIPPMVVISDSASVKLNSMAQVTALGDAMTAIGVQAGKPVGTISDPDGARRQAKAKALGSARGDADAYAKALGLRTIGVSRISEGGNQILLPGLQQKVTQAVTSGPQAFASLLKSVSDPATVHVEETIIVEFVIGQ